MRTSRHVTPFCAKPWKVGFMLLVWLAQAWSARFTLAALAVWSRQLLCQAAFTTGRLTAQSQAPSAAAHQTGSGTTPLLKTVPHPRHFKWSCRAWRTAVLAAEGRGGRESADVAATGGVRQSNRCEQGSGGGIAAP